MDKFSKFKVFSCLLIFCSVNVFLYRYFSRPEPQFVGVSEFWGSKRPHLELHTPANSGTTFIKNGGSSSVTQDDIKTNKTITGHVKHDHITQPILEKDLITPVQNLNTGPASDPLPPPRTQPSYQNRAEDRLSTRDSSNDLLKSTVARGDGPLLAGPGNMTMCPLVPPRLKRCYHHNTPESVTIPCQLSYFMHIYIEDGRLATIMEPASWVEIAMENPGVQRGGRYKPPNCQANHRVAIIIPYRNREEHLQILLRNLHPMLMRQQLDYGIFVVDQALPGKFNRAMLMNIGYAEAMKRYDYQCAVFHDVDLVPENDRNIYSCPEMPRHMSAAIDKFRYKLPYSGIYGGVSAVSKQQFEKINGFSNMFFGWGGEDDDMAYRIRGAGLTITRYPMSIARYKMIKHTKDAGNERNPRRHALLKTTTRRMTNDGLNSLVYEVQAVEELPTHLRIQVLINEREILKGKL